MSMHESVTPMSAGEAQNFTYNAMKEMDHLLIGESEAKLGMLMAMASGLNIVLVGAPGGGKTTLGEDSYRLIDGISHQDVAMLPVQADLQPQQLVGGEAHTTSRIQSEGDERVETKNIAIEAILKPDTKVIFANEINRINPLALNAMLEALESGKVDHTGGRTNLDQLEYAVSTMNPTEKREGVFPVAAALASRHAIGVTLGADDRNGERDQMISEVLGGWEPEPQRMSPVIDIDGLHALRARINSPNIIAFPESLKEEAVELIKDTHAVLRDEAKIVESEARLTKHVAKLARTAAVLRGEKEVESANLYRAVKSVLGARVGILGTKDTPSVDDLVTAVYSYNER